MALAATSRWAWLANRGSECLRLRGRTAACWGGEQGWTLSGTNLSKAMPWRPGKAPPRNEARPGSALVPTSPLLLSPAADQDPEKRRPSLEEQAIPEAQRRCHCPCWNGSRKCGTSTGCWPIGTPDATYSGLIQLHSYR